MGLCADTVNELAVGVDAVHQLDDTLDLGVVRVQVVVVDVELKRASEDKVGQDCEHVL